MNTLQATGRPIGKRPIASRRRCTALALAVALLSAPAALANGIARGLDAGGPLLSSAPQIAKHWAEVVHADGVGMIRVSLGWRAIAPTHRPSNPQQSDPGSAGYSWGATDAIVRQLADAGFSALLQISAAPDWAEGAHRPSSASPGSWRPDADALQRFALAAARRYSGRYPDPLRPGRMLPRVRYWEAWNEPNLSIYLSPQWTRTRAGYVSASPQIYRSLLNAVYAGVKRGSAQNIVVAGATAPYGDPQPGGQRISPVPFVAALLCLHGPRLKAAHCGAAPRFDIFDHHPYAVAGPFQPALNPGDVSVPDIGKLSRLIRAARRAGTVFPRRPKPIWVTELAWVSRPPDPQGTPLAVQALWLEQSLYELWHEGVASMYWLQLTDQPGSGGLDAGLYFQDGKPKPAATALRFPFIVAPHPRRSSVWGISPATGRLTIERRTGRSWRRVKAIAVRGGAVFMTRLSVPAHVTLRAHIGRQTSLPASV